MTTDGDSLGEHVAVVGAAGFLGRSLTNFLDARQTPNVAFTRNMPLVDAGKLKPSVGESSAIVWMASSINPLVAESHPELVETDRQNLEGALHLIADLPHPPRFVLLSSGGSVYGHLGMPPHSEQDPTKPTSAYGIAKLMMEQTVTNILDDSLILRVANAYGPGQPVARGQGVIAHWFRAIRRGEPVRVYGDTRTTRDYVYSMDICEAILNACRTNSSGDIVNIGSGSPTSLADLLHSIIRIADQNSVLVEYASGRSFDVLANYLDIDRARHVLDWAPKTDLETGLTATWDAVSRYGDPIS